MRTVAPQPRPEKLPYFVSTQVSESRRYFLDLAPKPTSRLAVVCGGCERMQPDYLVERDTFPFFVLEFVAEGAGSVELAGRRYRLQAGMTFSYGPGVAHTIRNEPARSMLKYFIVFAGEEGKRLLDESPLHGSKAVQVSSPKEIVELFEMLQREGASESEYGARICSALVPVLIMKITERAVPHSIAESRALATFHRVKHWMERHYLHLRTVEQAAQGCHVEVAYMSRLFQRFGHTTPYRFLMRLKMNRATQLLVDNGMLVKEVAAKLEFADAFHFSRAFKRYYGLPPGRFIKHNTGEPASR
ncbi:MAG TPA: AraC family transcriptional regulator [Chthoniobacterales bacterium]|jgi:AraC-like DNA-binding protein|nr:AraC family transcriptional regulator [Chthoniobacterales bacterium]